VVADRAALFESAMLGLRLADGVDGTVAQGMRRDHGMRTALDWGRGAGLVLAAGDGLALSPRGRLLADELFARMA
jgi:coproporphyrinogen III oxidase-like Fe-S oxidoreductase